MLTINSEHRLRQENLAFDIDVWWPLCRGQTADTVFLPLRRDEAEAIVAHYRSWCSIGAHSSAALRDENLRALLMLEQRLDAQLAHFGNEAFLRLCGRSPKDSLLRMTGEQFDELAASSFFGDEYAAMMEARRAAMCVRSGRDAMWVLLTSERVYADALDFVQYGEPEQVVLRAWDDDMHMANEFRAFVSTGRLIAVSQYDHYGYYPNTECARVQTAIERALALLRLRVPTFVADFLWCSKREACTLIEVSPLRRCTGSGLFTWDELLSWDAERPFEFRVTRAPRANIADLMSSWRETTFGAARPTTEPPYFVLSWWQRKWLLWNRPADEPCTIRLFFYGTLKRGFHWSNKYLDRAECLGGAHTLLPARLVVGDCGVPYCFFEQSANGRIVRGEQWLVNAEVLRNLDDYEGVAKGHYCRREIDIVPEGAAAAPVRAHVYAPSETFAVELAHSLAAQPSVEEYTLQMHEELYSPIAHIALKQALYLAETSATNN